MAWPGRPPTTRWPANCTDELLTHSADTSIASFRPCSELLTGRAAPRTNDWRAVALTSDGTDDGAPSSKFQRKVANVHSRQGSRVTSILVVDDDPRICDLLEALFHDEGYLTRRAADGVEAMAAIAVAMPDLIVTDLMMPRLDGAGLIRRLREQGVAIPIIVISAVYDNARQLDVTGFVPKPFDLMHLTTVVDQALAAAS